MGLSPVRFCELFPSLSEVLLSEVLGEGDFSEGFGVFDFTHEEGQRAVVWDQGFLYTIASAACEFLYLNNEYII